MKKKSNMTFRHLLLEEYEKRKIKNPAYSKRAYAKLLGVDQSSLTKLFKGEREFSYETIVQCLNKLNIPEEIRSQLEEDFTNRRSEYIVPEEKVLKILSHWKYWVVLEYLKIDKSYDPKGIAAGLGLSEKEIISCLIDLEKLNYIKRNGDKLVLLKPNNSWISNDRTTEARKEFQRRLLKLSLQAIDNVPVELREHGSLTVAIDRKKLPKIKEKIREFQQELGKFAQKKGNLNEVYQLTISFFPMTK